MEKVITISVLSLIFFAQCSTTKMLSGTYTDHKNMEFMFNDIANKFEYYFRSEMGLLQYCKGKYFQLNNNKFFLQGFNEINLKTIDIESTITRGVYGTKTQFELHWGNGNAANDIRSVVVINGDNEYKVLKDTVFTVDYKVDKIQVKCFLSYSGLYSAPPTIDTLYSSKITIGRSDESKNILLSFEVDPKDFKRKKISDTIIVKNNRTICLNKTKLKKIHVE